MAEFFEIFKDSFKDTDTKTVKGNVSIAVSDLYPEDLKEIKQKLAAHNMRPGKFIGVGNVGVVFQLETADGRPIKSAVLRIDPQGMIGSSDTRGALRPLFQTKGFFYAASVMPKAEKIPGGPTMEHLKRTLAVINSDDHLQHLSDIELSQLMYLHRPNGELMRYLDGTPAALIIDLNAVKRESKDTQGLGNIASFIEVNHLNHDEIMNTKAAPKEIVSLQRQQSEIYAHAMKELHAVGVDVGERSYTARVIGQALLPGKQR